MPKKTNARPRSRSKLDKSGRQIVNNRSAKRYNPRMGQASADSLPVAEVARLLGVSVRTVKRLCSQGNLRSFRTAGERGHLRVSRLDVEAFRQGSGSVPPVAPSNVLQARREHVAELLLEGDELRARRGLEKLRREEAEERARLREEAKAQRRQIEQQAEALRLEQDRLAGEQALQQRQSEAERIAAEFYSRWLDAAHDLVLGRKLFDGRWPNLEFVWLSAAQQKALLDDLEAEVRKHQPSDEARMAGLLAATAKALVEPWRVERDQRDRRKATFNRAETEVHLYLAELYRKDEISEADWRDRELEGDMKAAVRGRIGQSLDEPWEAVRKVVHEVIDSELGLE